MIAKRSARAPRKTRSAKPFGIRKARARDGALQQANEKLVLEVLRSNAAETDLREVAEFRERLIGVIGHDLRSPLNSVLMAAGLLASGRLPEAEAKLAGRILEGGRRMKRIISALMDFTRARLGGGFEIHAAQMDLGALCEQIAAELRLGASASVNVNVRGDVAGTWDEARLGEAISNVASNAVEHGAPNTAVDIDVAGADDDEVMIAITNRGPTIPPESMREIFEPFKQAPVARQRGHLGLGLFIARQVVLAHGGAMTVESAQGATTFTMRIPRGQRPI